MYQAAKREYFVRYPGGESYFDMAARVFPLPDCPCPPPSSTTTATATWGSSAGANPVPKWGERRNIDMAIDCNPKVRGTTLGSSEGQTNGSEIQAVNWVHSYFIGNSLFDTKKLYDKIITEINSTTEGNNE